MLCEVVMSMFYNWRKVDGYNAPIIVVVAKRGIGKTFGRVLKSMRDYVNTGKRFVYVVETLDDVKTLSSNKGERFFAGVKEYLENSTSKRSRKLYTALFTDNEVDNGETDLEGYNGNKILGGTIKINNTTAGYIIALNAFGNLKRNNFTHIKTIIIDEFIPEDIDIRHLKMPYKVASVIQTVARRQDVKIYMLGNSIRLDDILLVRLGLSNMKPGEIRVIKDEYGPLIVGHFVDNNEYSEFTKEADKSVAGRLAKQLGEDNLERNEFKHTLPANLLVPSKQKRSSLLFCLHGEADSIRINVTKDHQQYYVVSDYGNNVNQRYCFDIKYTNNVVQYRPEWKDILMVKYTNGDILFESDVLHTQFKALMKLDLNS